MAWSCPKDVQWQEAKSRYEMDSNWVEETNPAEKNHLAQWWKGWKEWVYYWEKPCSNFTEVLNCKFWI